MLKRVLSIVMTLCLLCISPPVHSEDGITVETKETSSTLSSGWDQAMEELKTQDDWYLPMYTTHDGVGKLYRNFEPDNTIRVQLKDNLGFSKTFSVSDSLNLDGVYNINVIAMNSDKSRRQIKETSYYVPKGEKTNSDAAYMGLIYAGVQPGFITIVRYEDLFEIE